MSSTTSSASTMHQHQPSHEQQERQQQQPTIHILYFAAARDATTGNITSEEITLSTSTKSISLQSLLQILTTNHPSLKLVLETAMVAINMEYVDCGALWKQNNADSSGAWDGTLVKAGDEVAIIPPVSGG
ncbi:hypothetical protein HDU76_004029 [Blyttiomyces sp. JEL0837]|nr:hypothetical protein HDU76_004029 [Blyttiomyces sp. JEL0837]